MDRSGKGKEMIRVSIGAEPSQMVNLSVLVSSILRRTEERVSFSFSYSKIDGWSPLMRNLPKISNGTKFALWRWIVPEAYGFEGKTIYLDSDQVCLSDIAELWELLPAGSAFAAVYNAVGTFGNKVPELQHWQTSVMVMDCSDEYFRMARDMIGAVANGTLKYRDLMQATWIDHARLTEIDPEWNSFNRVVEGTKLLHQSKVSDQSVRFPKNPSSEVWGRELIETIRAGHLSMEELETEVRHKHCHKHWLKTARNECQTVS